MAHDLAEVKRVGQVGKKVRGAGGQRVRLDFNLYDPPDPIEGRKGSYRYDKDLSRPLNEALAARGNWPMATLVELVREFVERIGRRVG
jgi:hypothetical protein